MLSFEKPIFELKRQLDELLSDPLSERTWGSIRKLQSELRQLTEEIFSNLTAWEVVQLARHESRPHSMSQVPTPVVSIIIGEGGSDGALAIGMADHLAIFEYAYFSVLAPEGCANILWKHARFADLAAEELKLTANDLFALKVVNEIIPEPLGGAHRDHRIAATNLKHSIQAALKELMAQDRLGLLERRYRKFRNIGQFAEPSPD